MGLAGPGAARCGSPRATRARCRTRRTATCSRWGRSSPSAHSSGVPGWVAQRLWMAHCCSASPSSASSPWPGGCGSARRARPAARRRWPTRWPRGMLTGLGRRPRSRCCPMALAPWVLVPLVTGARRGSPRRAAALSGLAVFCVGGVNAVATSAVLPLAGAVAAHPARRAAQATADGLVGRLGGAGDRLVDRAAAAARPLQPAVPGLHRDRAGHDRAHRTAVQRCAARRSGWPTWPTARGPLWPAGWALRARRAADRRHGRCSPALGLVGLARSRHAGRGWLVLGLLAGLALVDHRPPRRGRRACSPARCTDLLDGAAGAAAQRAQVRPGAPAAAGPRGRRTSAAFCSAGSETAAPRHPDARAGRGPGGHRAPSSSRSLATASPAIGGPAVAPRRASRPSPATGSRRRTGWPTPGPAGGAPAARVLDRRPTSGAAPPTSRCSRWRTPPGRSAAPSR